MSNEKPQEEVSFNRPSILLKTLFKQRCEGILCDVELRLQNNVIHVHGCVLASQSEYFVERFCSQTVTWDKHWCYVRPLIIDLGSEVDLDEHCFACLLKVVDYIYLKELVVKEGHCLHFYKYAYFFKIPELLALCKTYDKNLPLVNDSNNQVKSAQVCSQMKNKPKDCLSQEGGVTQDTHISGVIKCEFVCCNVDMEPSVEKGKNTKRRIIFCELCNFKTVSMKAMIKHVECLTHYGSKCPICRLQIPNGAQLKDHFMFHTGSKPYICHICNKRTRFWDTHKLHLRVHCQNKQFFCSICKTRFKEQKNLVVHMKSRHAESCYSCEHCGYLTSDFKALKSHIKRNSEKLSENKESANRVCGESNEGNYPLDTSHQSKKFACQACGKLFTLQKNLRRHIQLKHFSESQVFKCPKCDYLPKRLDMLKKHMNKRHRHLESLEIEQILERYRHCRRLNKNKTVNKTKQGSDILGVLIPVQLVSTSDSTILNALAVKTDNTVQNAIHPREYDNLSIVFNSEERINSIEIRCDSFHQKSTSDEFIANNSCENNIETNLQFSALQLNENECSNENLLDATRLRKEPNVTGDNRVAREERQASYRLSEEANGATDEIWLNESTGELLSGSGYVNLHVLNSEGSINQDISSLRKANLDVSDSFKTLLLNDQPREICGREFTEAKDDHFSNPQTPKTNVLDLEDTDNLISWNCLESPFCSTWVLNEATGELNMVSFSVKSETDLCSDRLEINKTSDGLSSLDDDDTALFLNEGTGDLSVIYFNPKNSRDQLFTDIIGQETLETMSDHSDDEDIDFLNEELLRVSANFMADNENEKFLNELTGEFDVASFSRFQTDVLAYQTSNHVYLNEETGEISWNVLDQDTNSDFVTTNSDILNLDFDDSMNFEEYDNFPTTAEFPAEFCMESGASSDWQNVNESCDTLLNECTGELVHKI